jgi:hypothetical protein
MTQRTRSTNAIDRRKLAAAKTRQNAQSQQARDSGSSHLNWPGKIFQAKNGMTTIWTFIPYKITEKHHPDEEVTTGEQWYKRPYLLHRKLGAGEYKKKAVCPKSFHPRNHCSVDDDVEALRRSVRERRKNLTESQYKEEMESASRCKSQKRDLFLVYDHNEKEIFLVDEARGWGNMSGLGLKLRQRVTNLPQYVGEEAAAFWLDGNDGMALSIQWTGEEGKWITPSSIDFVPREKYPVPEWVWGKAVELSTLLVKLTDKQLWAIYQELSPEEEENEDTEEQEVEEEQPQEEPPVESPGDPEGEFNFEKATVKELIKFASDNQLLDEKYLFTILCNKDDNTVYNEVLDAWENKTVEPEPEPEPPPPPRERTRTRTQEKKEEPPPPTRERTRTKAKAETSVGECPAGGKFGKDFNELDKCTSCPDETYDACTVASNR